MFLRLFLTIFVVNISALYCYEVPQLSDQEFFFNVNSYLHYIMNELFNLLKLLKHFSKISKNELLLTMHNDINNLSLKNYETFEVLNNLTDKSVLESYKSKLIEALKEVIEEERKMNNTKGVIDKINDITVLVNNADGAKLNISKVEVFGANGTGSVSFVMKQMDDVQVWRPNKNQSPELTRRLYHARPTSIKEYPFMASVHILADFICSGSIISKNLVLTAASCVYVFYQKSPRSIFIRVGSNYTKRSGVIIQTTKVIFHPGFDQELLRNNLAIVRLQKSLKLRAKMGVLKRIEMERDELNIREGVHVFGWGAHNEDEESNNLQILGMDYLDIYEFDACRQIYTDYYLTKDNFCAGYKTKGSGACNRDVGGPALRDGRLVGVISYGSRSCGMRDAPTVFSVIPHYVDWIDLVVAQEAAIPKANYDEPDIKPEYFHTTTEFTEVTPLTTTVDYSYVDELAMLKEFVRDIVFANDTDNTPKNSKNSLRQNTEKPETIVSFNIHFGPDKKLAPDNVNRAQNIEKHIEPLVDFVSERPYTNKYANYIERNKKSTVKNVNIEPYFKQEALEQNSQDVNEAVTDNPNLQFNTESSEDYKNDMINFNKETKRIEAATSKKDIDIDNLPSFENDYHIVKYAVDNEAGNKHKLDRFHLNYYDAKEDNSINKYFQNDYPVTSRREEHVNNYNNYYNKKYIA